MIDIENKELIEEILAISCLKPDDLFLYLDNNYVQKREDYEDCLEAAFISLCENNNSQILRQIVLKNGLNCENFKNKISFKALIYSLLYDSYDVLNYLIFEYRINESTINWEFKIDGLNIVRNMILARNLEESLNTD